MAPTAKALPEALTVSPEAAATLRIAIVHARWNREVIDALVAGAVATLKEHGVKESNIVVQSVPGSFELPLAAQRCVCSGHLSSHVAFWLTARALASSLAHTSKRARRRQICLAA